MASPASYSRKQHLPGRLAEPSTPRSYTTASTDTRDEPYSPQFSLSETRPFDWAAARGEKPAPYGGSPATQLARRKTRQSTNSTDSPRARLVRKASWWTRITDYPSHLWFEITLMPHRAPLPAPKVMGRALGAFCHALTLLVHYAETRPPATLDDLGPDWGDMREEIRGSPGRDFTRDGGFGMMWFMGWAIFLASIANTLWVFTRFKPYDMHMREDVLTSPNAKIVRKDLNLEYKPEPPMIQWLLMLLGRQIRDSFCFLIGYTILEDELDDRQANIQRLDVWTPGELEIGFFTIYSPLHSMMYPLLIKNSYFRVFILMLSLTAMLHGLVTWYDQLIKDRATLLAEVMYEYDHKFVFPRINPLRRDACVMTNEAEFDDYKPVLRDPARQPRTSIAMAQPKTWQQIQTERQQNGSPRASGLRQSVGGGGGLLRF